VPSTPEPATWGAIVVMLSVLALLARRTRRLRRNRFTD
jgi:Ca-activated chloride channel homolog